MTDKTLPFPLDEAGISDWLARWQSMPMNDKVKQLSQILSDLHALENAEGAIWPVLMMLTPPALAFLDELDRLLDMPSQRYSKEKKEKIMHVVLQINQKLSGLLAARTGVFAGHDETCLAAFALTLHTMVGWLQRFYLYRDMPKPLYWETLGALYLRARALALLEKAPPALPLKSDIQYGALTTLFQHCLLYDVCCAGATAKTDVRGLFAVTGTLCGMLRITEHGSATTLYCWHPAMPLPPLRHAAELAQDGLLYLDGAALLELLEAQPNTLTSLLPRLNAYQALRATVDASKFQECGLVIGLHAAVPALNALISQYRILDLSGAIKQPRKTEGLSLEPLPTTVPTVDYLLKELSKTKSTIAALRIKAYATAQTHFFVTQFSSQMGRLDELAILLTPSHKPLLAIVRYLRVEAAIKIKHVLLELIEGEIYPITFGDQNGMIVHKRSGEIELFLPAAYYAKNTIITLPRGVASGRYKLTRFIELTACYVRYEIMLVE